MRIRFHVKMAIISQLTHSCVILGAIIIIASLVSMGRPLCLSEFFPTSFAQFFVWVCAFPILTIGAGLGIFFDFSKLGCWDLLTSDMFQMPAIGLLGVLSVFLYWIFVRFLVSKTWGLEWVKACTTIVKCFIFWGLFQLFCVFVSCAWTYGGLSCESNANSEMVEASEK